MGRQAAAAVEEFQPDLILLDLMMPLMDGYEVLEQVRREQAPGSFLPVMILTADPSEAAKQRALRAGATDFLIKPFERTECILRINNLLTTRRLHLALARENDLLESRVRQRTAALESALLELRSAQQQLVQRERLGALGSMVTGIAHDFNNTLAKIVGQGERLRTECRRAGVSREISDCAQTIISAALDAAETVGRLSDFHRPANPGEVHAPVKLQEIAHEAIDFTKPRWQAESRGRGAPIECVTEFDDTAAIAGTCRRAP
jgi:CheY-like chemotaxis protein